MTEQSADSTEPETGADTGKVDLPDESEGGEGVGLTMGDEPNTFEPEEDHEAAAGED